MTVEGDAKVSQLFWLLLSNTPTYAGVRIAADAAVNDGLLDSCLVEGNGGLHAASTAARVVLNPGGDAIAASKVAHLSIKTPGIPIQIDGEDIGNTPVDFGVSPGALPILLPPGAGQHLFKEPEPEPLRVWNASSAHLINATSTEVGEVIPLEADVARLDPLAAQVDDSRVTRSRSQSESVSSKR